MDDMVDVNGEAAAVAAAAQAPVPSSSSGSVMPMETVVTVAIGVLCLVFVGSLVALILLCHHRYCARNSGRRNAGSWILGGGSLFGFWRLDKSSSSNLIAPGQGGYGPGQMELDDVRLHPEIDKILADSHWVDDATGLAPHCLAILRVCHTLTERLVAATVAALNRFHEDEQQKRLWEIISVAQRISPRVDDVVQGMYPPLDPRLLEARCTSLVLSVTHLALIIRFLCHVKSRWIDEELRDLDDKLRCLRETGEAILCLEEAQGLGAVGYANSAVGIDEA